MGFKKAASVGLEISREYISAVELVSGDKEVVLKKHGKTEVLPSFIVPSLSEKNIPDADKFKETIKTLFSNAGISGKRISLAVPDAGVKISFVEFEDIPKEREKVMELIKWNLKKALPFPSDEAIVDFQIINVPSDRSRLYRLIVALMRKAVLEQYEILLSDCRLIPEVIIPSSFASYNLYHDCLLGTPVCALLTVSPKNITVMVIKHGKPCFHRSKEIGGEKDALREISASLNYYHDIDGEMPARIYLVDTGLKAEQAKVDIEMCFGGIDIKPIGLPDMIKGADASMNIFSGAAGAALNIENER